MTDELRALRVWHWRIAMNARRAAKCYREQGTVYSNRQAKTCDRRADFHIKAVQALNDVVSGTAEQDDAKHIKSLGSEVL